MTDVTSQIKLTNTQKEFFATFTKNAIQNILVSQTAPEYVQVVQAVAADILKDADVSALAEGIGKSFLTNIDFKTLSKVDKFLKSPEYIKSVEASAIALASLHSEIGDLVQDTANMVSAVLGSPEVAAE